MYIILSVNLLVCVISAYGKHYTRSISWWVKYSQRYIFFGDRMPVCAVVPLRNMAVYFRSRGGCIWDGDVGLKPWSEGALASTRKL
jgi:hypothetical protein